jgi:hypothetical protein
MSKINEAIQQMSIEEMQQRLAEYMAADKEWAPKPIAIEVRHRDVKDIVGTNIYDVIILKDDDTEDVIKFPDRYSKLVYIYTLLHPKGFQRYTLNKPEKRYPELSSLYSSIFMIGAERLIDYLSKEEKSFNQMMNQAITGVRKAFMGKVGCEELVIDRPNNNNGRTLIPAVRDGLEVIIDSQLKSHC